MSERRMFAKSIIDTDAFLELPLSTQALYFHLSMRADDEGFVSKPKSVQRLIRASDDDFKLLIAKRYILIFDTGVIVIKHWKIHNYIRGDRLQKTNYRDEREKLVLQSNGAYTEADGDKTVPIQSLKTLVNAECQSSDSQMSGRCQSSVSIGKDSIGKDSIDLTIINDSLSDSKSDPKQKIIEMWNELSVYGIPPVKRISEGSKRMTCLRSRMKQFTLDDFAEAIEQIKQSSFLQGKNKQGWMITFDWFILPSNFSKVLEGNYNDKKGARNSGNVKAGLEQYSSGNAERDREMDEINRRIESGEADADDDGLWD